MKRSSLVGIGLLPAAALGLFLSTHWARWKIEQGVGRFLQIPVRIERVHFTPRGFTLHQATFPTEGTGSYVPLRIEKIQLEGIPWREGGIRSVTLTGLTLFVADVPLRAQGRVSLTAAPRSYARVEGWLNLEHPFLRGRVEVSGRLLKPVVLGWMEWAGESRRFVAQLEVSREALRLARMEIQGGWSAGGSLTPRRGSLTAVGPEEDRFLLQVNPSPAGGTGAVLSVLRSGLAAQEIWADWRVRGSRLELQSRLFGDQAVLSGQIGLDSPYRSAFRLELNDLDLAAAAAWFPAEGGSNPPAGRLSGEIHLSGPLHRLSSIGRLSGQHGKLGAAEFDWISFHFRGTGPLLQLQDSRLTGPVGSMRMEGVLDLRRIGRKDFIRGLRLSPADRIFREAGWPLTLTPGRAGLKLGRTDAEEGMNLRADLDPGGGFVGVERRKRF